MARTGAFHHPDLPVVRPGPAHGLRGCTLSKVWYGLAWPLARTLTLDRAVRPLAGRRGPALLTGRNSPHRLPAWLHVSAGVAGPCWRPLRLHTFESVVWAGPAIATDADARQGGKAAGWPALLTAWNGPNGRLPPPGPSSSAAGPSSRASRLHTFESVVWAAQTPSMVPDLRRCGKSLPTGCMVDAFDRVGGLPCRTGGTLSKMRRHASSRRAANGPDRQQCKCGPPERAWTMAASIRRVSARKTPVRG